MARNEGKAKSARRALRDVSNNFNNHVSSNNGGGGKFSKSVNTNKKLISEKQIESQQSVATVQQECSGGGEEEDYLDRLLLVQSNLSSLTRQIDELVAEAFKLKATSKEGRGEVESFSHVLSDMLSSLKPWVPRFQKVLSSPSKSENESGKRLGEKIVSAVNEDENLEVESPEQTRMDSLISPSPLVSWRADCNIERGKQLFLLTPLPISKTLSSKHQDLSKSLFERIASNPAVELPSILSVSGDLNDDLLEGIATKPTLTKPSDLLVNEGKSNIDSECFSPPILSKRDHSIFVMTPCLKMSPPKSCVLLEPVSEPSHKNRAMVRQSTPFPVGLHSQISESPSDSEGSEDLAFKYPELLGIQAAYKSKFGQKELEASPKWSFSPPKTCVLLEPPDEKSPDTIVAADNHLPISAPLLNQQTNLSLSKYNDQDGCHEIKKSCNHEPIHENFNLVESTPVWKEPESTIRRGKRPGENTLKKELWTKFEAASTYGLRLNAFSLQRTAQKGFLDMLDEVSLDGGRPSADSLR
ncbi:hypothetical protein JCGZ_24857 [Jatropha curcas]|uniref:Uncharacterized protein n=1 Tax=Jatropha curcas TaxID=180498 RepID=A0A067L0V5_JATCU|nr:uncharacterized protein LOC105631539 [Jatropha curcas]KDP40858.1 hypothetical protein JCGZ_24857 [Jatropha curcas]